VRSASRLNIYIYSRACSVVVFVVVAARVLGAGLVVVHLCDLGRVGRVLRTLVVAHAEEAREAQRNAPGHEKGALKKSLSPGLSQAHKKNGSR